MFHVRARITTYASKDKSRRSPNHHNWLTSPDATHSHVESKLRNTCHIPTLQISNLKCSTTQSNFTILLLLLSLSYKYI